MNKQNPWIYRVSQFVSFLLGIRFFVLVLFVFALYVSTYFLFNQEESLRRFVFDYKVHGIIFCAVLSVAAGGVINQFYDKEKDRLQKPFRSKLQTFLKQRYFLYLYLGLNILSLSIAWLLSPRIFIFFFVYQFFMWFYSHKLSKIVFLNNITYVSLTLYPFFGMLVYYQHFSVILFWMAAFLFLILLIIDNIKDILTLRADKVFGYHTVPNTFSLRFSVVYICVLILLNVLVSAIIVTLMPHFSYSALYFSFSIVVLILALYPLLFFRFSRMFWLMNLLRIWVFIGVVFMLLNGIYEKF